MSRADRGFALFLVVVAVVMVTLFWELFPRHDTPSQSDAGQSPPAPAAQPK